VDAGLLAGLKEAIQSQLSNPVQEEEA